MNLISKRKISQVPRNSTIRFQIDGRFLKGTKGDQVDDRVKVYVIDPYKTRWVELPADTEVEVLELGKFILELG